MRRHRRNITIINNEIDYDKLAEAIVKAQRKAEELEKINNQKIKEKQKEEIFQNRIEALDCADCLDEDRTLKSKAATFKFCWKLIKCDEDCLKNISLLGDTVNRVVSLLFGLIEWIMYFFALGFIVFGIIVPIYKSVFVGEFTLIQFSSCITSFSCALMIFMVSRLIIRILKIECKYSKDANYMLNFLAVIIAVVAVIVSIVVR